MAKEVMELAELVELVEKEVTAALVEMEVMGLALHRLCSMLHHGQNL
jgi:hypothetical protein